MYTMRVVFKHALASSFSCSLKKLQIYSEMATLRVPYSPPSPVEDAQDLRKAFEGWGTDEKKVITIISHRDQDHRKQIISFYEQLYNENLIKRLEKELTSDLQKAICYWMFEPIEREALMVNSAIKKTGIDYRVIIEIACVSSPKELLAIRESYHARYKQSLEEDVASHSVGNFRKLLVALVSTYRYSGLEINERLAKSEAKTLHDAIVVALKNNTENDGKESADENQVHVAIEEKTFHQDEIVRILSTRSKAQLNATFNRYKDEYGTSLTKDLSNASPDEYGTALRAVIRCIISPQKYYEKVLRYAINKVGTDEDALTRVVVTRAEKDLKEIKEMYKERTSVALDQAIGKEISGDYKDFLLALVEE